MSITCAFMSSSPSSNIANSPHGPAPMISTSVLIGSVMRLQTADDRRRTTDKAVGSMPGHRNRHASYAVHSPMRASVVRPLLCLPLGGAHDEPVELRGHLDLTRQARIRPHVVAEIEH